MPGMSAGLNHSLEIQACGLIRMPCSFSSPLSSRRQSASQLPRSVSLSLRIGRLSSRWSGQEAVQDIEPPLSRRSLLKHRAQRDKRADRQQEHGSEQQDVLEWTGVDTGSDERKEGLQASADNGIEPDEGQHERSANERGCVGIHRAAP